MVQLNTIDLIDLQTQKESVKMSTFQESAFCDKFNRRRVSICKIEQREGVFYSKGPFFCLNRMWDTTCENGSLYKVSVCPSVCMCVTLPLKTTKTHKCKTSNCRSWHQKIIQKGDKYFKLELQKTSQIFTRLKPFQLKKSCDLFKPLRNSF